MDGDDAYYGIVEALLKQAVGAPTTVHVEVLKRMNQVYTAVPKWMLKLGAAYNPGCSALYGLETFKVTSPHTLCDWYLVQSSI